MRFLHIGDHSMLHLDQIPWHLLEPDHIFFIAFAAIVGVLAYRHGRKVEARIHAKREERS